MKKNLKWSLRAYALLWSVVFMLLYNFSVGMPRVSVLFVLSDEGTQLLWICRQNVSNDVVNVTVTGFGHFFSNFFLSFPNVLFLFSWI